MRTLILTSMLIAAAMFSMFLFLTYYMQGTLGYSALKTGFAFAPFSVGIIVSAMVASVLLPRVGGRPLMITGLLRRFPELAEDQHPPAGVDEPDPDRPPKGADAVLSILMVNENKAYAWPSSVEIFFIGRW